MHNDRYKMVQDLADGWLSKYRDCVRQLTEAHARIDRFESEPKGWWNKEVEELKQKLEMAEAIIAADGALITGLKNDLAAALAAFKAKDEAINAIATTGVIREAKWCGMSAKDIAELALAIQPDDSALKMGLDKAWQRDPDQ